MASRELSVDVADSEKEPVSQTIVSIVSEMGTCDPIELDPLYEYVDPDALNRLFHSGRHSGDRDEISIEFTYMTYCITVTGNYVHVSEEPAENGSSGV
ncbi:hypothetical protein Htur_4848 (plasmid) [Haloterrigena turkmenica DSM 5511]|uniref:Halobacterial output domain-containing protein n=1 Tax=Haloterrigena turkmenica (strain ATCC 51198 / DSM 5511 / JCM 9101 / NCIMB 13204 / VKM B-1734 / 4k) TaxID=543526 RepID=D2S2K9_HALTV|nr:HalOD1 output domain-containing protein [Haloterrigena turkmenica]ADB63606.1 hypothetical protein Htur_4848 [Haloterrigena turkmenica DSM 5511]